MNTPKIVHPEFYLHRSHGSGCEHCRAVMQAVCAKLERTALWLGSRREWPAETIVRLCKKEVELEYKERQDSWL